MSIISSRGRGRKEIYTYAVLYDAAQFSLKQAEATPQWRFYNLLNCIVSSAFALEAYLNHIGPHLLPYWASLERIGPRQKLHVLTSHLTLKVSYGVRPYQSCMVAFDVRDFVAHGRTELITFKGRPRRSRDELYILPASYLERICRLPTARNVVQDARRVIQQLHTSGGRADDILWATSFEEWEGTLD